MYVRYTDSFYALGSKTENLEFALQQGSGHWANRREDLSPEEICMLVTEKKRSRKVDEAQAVRNRLEEESLIATERMARFLCFAIGNNILF